VKFAPEDRAFLAALLAPAPAENPVHADQAACWYSWRVPPSRSCRRMSRWAIW
jgi:hypothetical protein